MRKSRLELPLLAKIAPFCRSSVLATHWLARPSRRQPSELADAGDFRTLLRSPCAANRHAYVKWQAMPVERTVDFVIETRDACTFPLSSIRLAFVLHFLCCIFPSSGFPFRWQRFIAMLGGILACPPGPASRSLSLAIRRRPRCNQGSSLQTVTSVVGRPFRAGCAKRRLACSACLILVSSF